jgi:hypothetical protein
LSVSLDCPFLIVVSVPGLSILDCCQCLWIVHSWLLSVSLDCPFLIVVSVSGLLILDCCQCLWIVHSWLSLKNNPETQTTIKNGQSRDTDNNQEWTIQRHWQQSRMDNPETLTTIKNGHSRDTDNNQEWTIQGHWQQSRIDNPEKLTTQWYNWCLCIILFYSGM